uniref:Uncharacterized protein n=1 Tax=Arundo donax TaxID=35708 RepID=A0A0A9H3M3_ARUDO
MVKVIDYHFLAKYHNIKIAICMTLH